MGPRLSVREAETIPDGTSVRDYDQLDPEAMQYFTELARAERPLEVPPRVAAAFDRRELIKYTDYLRVRPDERSDSSPSP